jgi:hypothetical protein
MVSTASLFFPYDGIGLIGTAGILYWLSRPGSAGVWSYSSLILLPVLIFYAPSPAALTITILIEAPIVFGLATAKRFNGGQASLRSCFINALTQPMLHIGMVSMGITHWWGAFLSFEILMWVVEAYLYLATMPGLRSSPDGIKKAFAISFLSNLASATAGLMLSI